MSFDWIKEPAEPEIKHVLVVHNKCRRRYQDYYLADVILSLLRSQKKVTICTTELYKNSPISNVEDLNDNVYFIIPWQLMPKSIFGLFESFFLQMKLLWLVLCLVVCPPQPTPELILTDTTALPISLLKRISSYKVLYIKHFSSILNGDVFDPEILLMPTLKVVRFLRRADRIIVQTNALKRLLEKTVPGLGNNISVLHPCYDTGFWQYEPLSVRSIVPNLPYSYHLFVVLAEFKDRSNLMVAVNSIDFLVRFTEIRFSIKVHLVIAGYSEPLGSKELAFVDQLEKKISARMCANNVTILKRTSVLEQKSLITHSVALINPVNDNVYPGAILMAMNLQKPVVTVNNGFAKNVLKHEFSGFLLDDRYSVFAEKIEELAKNPSLGETIGNNAKNIFQENYSFEVHSAELNKIVDKYYP